MSHVTLAMTDRPLAARRAVGARARGMLVALVVAVLIAGCGGLESASTDAGSAAATASATPVAAAAEADTAPALVARADGALAVHDAPDDTSPSRTLPATTSFGTPAVVLVTQVGTGDAAGWFEVLLPVRPNGTTGWVREDEVDTRTVDLAVHIDLAARTLSVLDGDEELLSTSTAIGDPDHPTPTGRFYVIDKLETPNPDGAYGPFALGLSAHSDVLTEFAGGDGQVGIHGTNAPGSIGQAVSHGCLRVDNALIERLAQLLPLGTPVTIV
jgi:lipoprotein-anchoring transpeptidase ErfK/SrfK